MIAICITFDNGHVITTMFNGDIHTARVYYAGQPFNFGDTDAHPQDDIGYAVRVEELHP